MKLIERDYLKNLIDVIGSPDIKVITWVRRSGKSKLLWSFKDYVKNNIGNANIIDINFNLLEFEDLKNYKALNEYVESKYKEWDMNFVCIDEIQMCTDFEKTINSLHASEKYDIYITWSNAFLLSSDLATLFTWRTFEINIYPFSFKEFLKYYEYEDLQEAFDKYLLQWWMAGSYIYQTDKEKYKYISWVHDTLLIRDIINRYKLQYKGLLENLNNYLMDNISNITSSWKIVNDLASKWVTTNHSTIESYLSYLCNAFLYYKIKRYDIQWKKYLATQDKYYLVDHGFKYAKLWIKNMNIWRLYENIVAIELLRRWYELYIWVLYDKEIDFVAIKQNEKIYIQVSSNIEEENTFNREITPLLKIKDAYPKVLIARTKQPYYQYEWIQIFDIADWLAS